MSVTENEHPSDAIARAERATRQIWNQIAEQWGLLTDGDVRDRLRLTAGDLEALIEDGAILRMTADGAPRYPGFQFEHGAHRIRPWVVPLVRLAHTLGRSAEDVTLWFVKPTTFLGPTAQRPVDHLDDPDLIIDVARKSWDNEW